MNKTQQLKYTLVQSALSLNSAINAGVGIEIITRLKSQLNVAQTAFLEA